MYTDNSMMIVGSREEGQVEKGLGKLMVIKNI